MSNELWVSLAAAAGGSLDAAQHERLARYLDLLLETNRRINLTRITDRTTAEVQHVGDALTLLPFLPKGSFSLVDVGSGGGVPGIPLAIARPDAQVLLIESTKKKAVPLERFAAELGLANLSVSATRAEDAGRSSMRETFDVATARAVATLDWLAEWCLPLVKVGGKVLAQKGERVAEELPLARKAIHMLGGSEPVVHPVALPGTTNHVIVEIVKIRRTPSALPRSSTQSKGKALGN
jgi:16S rRNA (guanine527-N7)-methyltransferase